MNDRQFVSEAGVAVILGLLLLVLGNPFTFWMPDMLTISIVGAFVVAFALFAVFVWRESAEDEREQLHRMVASRVAFLAGSTVLLVGIVFEVIVEHKADPWLLLALAAMILGKTLGRMWSRKRY